MAEILRKNRSEVIDMILTEEFALSQDEAVKCLEKYQKYGNKKAKDYFYGLLQKVYQLQHVSEMHVFVGYTGFINHRCK